ncbi:integrase core domain-containing protein [Sphingomonas montana]
MFPSLTAASRIIGAARTDYNTVRPHSSLAAWRAPSLPTALPGACGHQS